MTPPRRASTPIGGCALTLACAALMITGPASAQSASGFYLSQELGLNLAAPVDLLGNSNDRASHCDEFINPRFAEIPGCTDPDRGSGAGWKTAYDGATGILAGLSAGYRFSRRLRVEAEWFHRESEYDQTSPVASATGATFAKLDGEIQRAEDRICSISSQNVFANVHVDLLTGIAVEVQDPKGLGRCRMGPLPDASASSLHGFVTDHVEPGARVITDGWQGYHGVEQLGYLHDRHSQRAARTRGADPHELLPAVHRVASLVKRWLLGTHQGSVGDAHLPGYLNEFVFRFNRRRSRSRGLVFFRVLQLAATHAPVRYQDLVAHTHPRVLPPTPPPTRGHPPSLERPPANRPWRAVDLGYSG